MWHSCCCQIIATFTPAFNHFPQSYVVNVKQNARRRVKVKVEKVVRYNNSKYLKV